MEIIKSVGLNVARNTSSIENPPCWVECMSFPPAPPSSRSQPSGGEKLCLFRSYGSRDVARTVEVRGWQGRPTPPGPGPPCAPRSEEAVQDATHSWTRSMCRESSVLLHQTVFSTIILTRDPAATEFKPSPPERRHSELALCRFCPRSPSQTQSVESVHPP